MKSGESGVSHEGFHKSNGYRRGHGFDVSGSGSAKSRRERSARHSGAPPGRARGGFCWPARVDCSSPSLPAPLPGERLGADSRQGACRVEPRLLVGNAREETLDSAGRLLVAPELRRFAQFDKQVWLVGQGSHFEIWSDAGWQKEQEAVFALGDQLPPGLEDLAL